MDFLATLLSFFISIGIGVTIALHSLTGALFPAEERIVILPPVVVAPATTTSSASLLPSSHATTTKKQTKTATSSQKPAATSLSKATTPPQPSTPPLPSISAEELNTNTRSALVNILCIAQGDVLHSISGTGVIIDSRGVILTNAHIGQYFLLVDYPTAHSIDCTIRVGSPAQPRYRATLLYLPPRWVNENASQLVAAQAKGTGEDDYAFLAITSSTGPTPLPSVFPTLPMTTTEPEVGDAAFLAAYPAGFLNGQTIEQSLFPTSAYSTVKELFTFSATHTVDLVSVGGTIVSQGGSSGGATVRASDGKLEAIIATATTGDTTAERDLRAITLGHIERSLSAEGQGGIATFLSKDLTQAVANFAATLAPSERETFVNILKH